MAAAQPVVGSNLLTSIGEILRPTKQTYSYAQIAIRASDWLRQQGRQGHNLGIERMSSEQVRKIFCDEVERPGRAYLQALAAVQGIDINRLYQAAGYPVPPEWTGETLRLSDDLSEEGKRQIADYIQEVIERERRTREQVQESEEGQKGRVQNPTQ